MQEQVQFFDRLTFTVGGRVDCSSNEGESVDAFSPRVGATYELLPGVALYANYSESLDFIRNNDSRSKISGKTAEKAYSE